jgi:hypothetical protein
MTAWLRGCAPSDEERRHTNEGTFFSSFDTFLDHTYHDQKSRPSAATASFTQDAKKSEPY